MKRFLLLIILGILLVFDVNAFAFNFSVDIPKIKLEVKGGDVIRGGLTVKNPSENEIRVKVYLEDFSYASPYDGTKNFFSPGSTEYSPAKWIIFSPQEIVLPAFGKKKVNYVVTVPPGVSGGYYAVLFFETSLGQMPDSEKGANVLILGRIGSLFLIETVDSIKKVAVEKITAEASAIKGEFINQGKVLIISKGSFYVMDAQGAVFDRGSLSDIYISPGDRAPLSLSLAEDIPAGRYILIITFDLGEGDILVREIDFVKDEQAGIKILQVRE